MCWRRRALDVVILDRSLKGMRLRLPAKRPLPRCVTVLVLQEVMAHEADVVWTRQGEAGLVLRSSVSVRAAAGPQGEALRQLWGDAMAWRSRSRTALMRRRFSV